MAEELKEIEEQNETITIPRNRTMEMMVVRIMMPEIVKVEKPEVKHQRMGKAKNPKKIRTNKNRMGCGEFRHSLKHYI